MIPKEAFTGANSSLVYITVVSKARASYLIRARVKNDDEVNEINPGTIESGILTRKNEISQHFMRIPNNGVSTHIFNVRLSVMSGSANL